MERSSGGRPSATNSRECPRGGPPGRHTAPCSMCAPPDPPAADGGAARGDGRCRGSERLVAGLAQHSARFARGLPTDPIVPTM